MKIYYKDEEFKYIWVEAVANVECPSCGRNLIADAQDGPCKCICGLTFQFVAYMKGEDEFETGDNLPLTN